MDRKIVTDGRPASPNLSPAVSSNGLLFVSGQTAGDVDGITGQTEAVLKKIGSLLKAAGLGYAAVLRCNVYLSDIRNWEAMNKVYVQYFTAEPPARTSIECKMASPAVLVEIDCVAALADPI